MIFSSSFLLLSALLSVSAEPALFLKVSGISPNFSPFCGHFLTSPTGAQKVRGVQNLIVTTTLENSGDVKLTLFNDPRSTLSHVPMNTFHITNANGSSPQFTGIRSKYVRKVIIANGRPESYTVLEPGQSIEVTHDRE